jgi:hypothetical protein
VPAETDLNQLWAKLVEAVGRASQFVNSYLKRAHPVSLIKNVLTIGFDPEDADQLPLVDNSRNHSLLQTKLAELGYPQAQVRFIVHDAPVGERAATPAPLPVSSSPEKPVAVPGSAAPASAASPAAAPAPLTQNDFKNDPLILEGAGDFQRPDHSKSARKPQTITSLCPVIGKLVKQASRMQQQMEQIQAQLATSHRRSHQRRRRGQSRGQVRRQNCFHQD